MAHDLLFSGIPLQSSRQFAALCAFCEANASQVLAALPWLAAEVAGSDGFATMLNLVRDLSGDRVHLSNDLERARVRLGVDLSADAHARLRKLLGEASLVDIPSAWGVFLALRRVAIQQALVVDPDHRRIAKRFGVTARALRKIDS